MFNFAFKQDVRSTSCLNAFGIVVPTALHIYGMFLASCLCGFWTSVN